MIGVNTAVYGEGMGIGFAIPSARAPGRRGSGALRPGAGGLGRTRGRRRAERPGSRGRPETARGPAGAASCRGQPRRPGGPGRGATWSSRSAAPRCAPPGSSITASAATASARPSPSPCAGGRPRSISPSARSSSRPSRRDDRLGVARALGEIVAGWHGRLPGAGRRRGGADRPRARRSHPAGRRRGDFDERRVCPRGHARHPARRLPDARPARPARLLHHPPDQGHTT